MNDAGQAFIDMFLSIEAETRGLALLAWDHDLDDVQIATLRELGIDRAGWAIRFGNRLVPYVTMQGGVPSSDQDLSGRLEGLLVRLPELAATYVRILHKEVRTEGVDKMAQDAAIMAVIDAKFREAGSDQPSDDPIVTALRVPMSGQGSGIEDTPFDPLIRRLTPKGDRVSIGPFALVGGLELMALAVIVVLAWVPLTLAATWRLAVFREFGLWTLVKAAAGWSVILLAVLALGSPQ